MKWLICLLAIFALTSCILGERREPDAVFEDSEIDQKIHYDITNHSDFESDTHINIVAYNRKVLLTGQVPNEEIKQQLTDIAKNTENVQTVYNQVTIGPPTGLVQRATDTWITTHVKSLLLSTNRYGLNQTKVITELNVVYLMGIVTQEEADIAVEKAQRVKGVKEVAKFFEYIAIREEENV